MNKVIRDGKVAVLYSPKYQGGWYTGNTSIKECLFDPDIVALVERGASHSDIVDAAKEKWPDGDWGAAGSLKIKWVEVGKQFYVCEYDTSEDVMFMDDFDFITA